MSEVSEYIWYLKFKNAGLKRELDSYRNGNKYVTLREEYESICRSKDAEIRKLKEENAKCHKETVTVRKYWSEIFDDIYKETQQEILRERNKTAQMEDRALNAERQRDKALDDVREWRKKYYELSEKTEELEGLNKKLTAQVNKDFQNSSIPSSQQGPGRKKIPNSREKTGKKRGGQPGHEGHRLQQRKPTETHRLKDPDKYVNDPDYYATEEVVSRQRIFLDINVKVIEYTARVFRNRKTGTRAHADFPEGYDTDISYDGSVKSAAYLLNNECNVSLKKVRRFLMEVSKGAISLSESHINNLCEEFSKKSEPERKDSEEKLMTSPVLNVDFTNAVMNGNSRQVLIVGSPCSDAAMYIARENKGHKGIQGTLLENYVGTLVHDHDTTFYSYGLSHQECMQHTDRYAIGSVENEPEFTWNKMMHELIGEMIHYRKHLGDEPLDPVIVEGFEKRYDSILEIARKEYEDTPPSDYYREGYNLYKRLVDFKESELLFLHDKNVPPDNSLAERLGRVFKRKQKQIMTFRSDPNLTYTCDGLSVLHVFRIEPDSMYEKTSDIFNRRRPKRIPDM